MLSTEERLAALEKSMAEIRWRLGLAGPPVGEVNGIFVGQAGVVLQPDQQPTRNQAQEALLAKIAVAQATPPLTAEEACAKWDGEGTLNAFFPSGICLTDHESYLRVVFKKGWVKVPQRF